MMKTAAPSGQNLLATALRVISRQAQPMLLCALLAFGGAALLAAAVYLALAARAYGAGESVAGALPQFVVWQYYVRAAAGAALYVIGRGAITWLALQPAAQAPGPGARMALRAALKCWRGLAASAVLYGVLITAGVVALNIFLRALRLDISNYRFVRDDAGSLLSALLIHGLALLPPEPGAPFDELLTVQRFLLSRTRGAYFGVSDDAPRILGADLWATGACAVLALIIIETLLCLRTALVMDGAQDGWLRATLRLARAHFWRVLTLRWGLRLLSAALVVAGSTLPTLLQQAVFFPMVLRAARSYWPFALNSGLALLGVTLPLMLLSLLSVVYEARLYLALTAPSARDQ